MIVAGTLDTKGAELRFLRDQIAAAGVRVVLVDLSTSGGPSPADVPPHHIAAYYRGGPNAVFTGDRGAAITAMAEAFEAWIRRQDRVGGLISAGGSGGSSLVAPAMRALPIGVPKVLISSVASGNVAPYVGPSDIMMLYSVTDVAGSQFGDAANPRQRRRGHGRHGEIARRERRARSALARRARNKPAIGLTMFGVTTPCVDAVVDALEDDFECLVFHATGVGGQSMEKLVDSGDLAGVIDITTTEVCDLSLRRRTAGHRRSLRRDHPHARALYRFVRRARHGEFRTDGQRARALPRPHAARSQPDRDADAHDARGECTDRALDRRAAQPHGRPGALLSCRKAACPRSTRPGGRFPIRARTRNCFKRPGSDRSANRRRAVSIRMPAHINDPHFSADIAAEFRRLFGGRLTRRRARG